LHTLTFIDNISIVMLSRTCTCMLSWWHVMCSFTMTNIHGICLVLTTMHVSQTDAM